MNRTMGKQMIPVSLGVATASGAKPLRWLAVVVGLGAFLAGLAYAETVWLHNGLPHDQATRIALVVFPDARAAGAGDEKGASAEWSPRLMQEATDTDLLRGLISRLDLRNPSTSALVSPEELAASMRLGSQCIERTSRDSRSLRGLLLYNVVRGSDAAEIDRIAHEWSKMLIARSASEFPGLVIQPVDAPGVSYEICR